ncbi:hypothetical protein [Archangium sp.]|uniref:hypothetical protein n=1 Tax=Archangium sp. TaxID=1872627 RepID=UPI003899AED3
MNLDPYTLSLAEGSRLKLRGAALFAEGGADAGYEAAVLFHEAARAETRALAALPSPSAETRLRSAIERCGCLIDGKDPSAVLEVAWPEVLELSDEVAPSLARALRARVDARVEQFVREYREAAGAAPDFLARLRSPGTFSVRAARQLDRVLRRFPGDPRLWTMKALNAVVDGDDPLALECARRARRLLLNEEHPERIEGMAPGIEIIVSAKALALPEARAAFDASHARVRSGPAEADLCLAVVAAGLHLVERARRGTQQLWERIAEVASVGASLPEARTRLYLPLFRAARMIAMEELADRTPGLEILYRVGLGTAVSLSESKDPIAILSTELTERLLRPAA